MNCRQIFSVPVRLISRSTTFQAAPAGAASKISIKLKEETPIPVEKDTEKLANYVCGSNLFNEGEDVKLKPDSEYPEWLWKILPPLPLDQYDKNSKKYWLLVNKQGEKERNYLRSLDKTLTVHK